jgi:hypothetical protein
MDAAATMKMTQRIGRHGQLEKCQVSRVDPQDPQDANVANDSDRWDWIEKQWWNLWKVLSPEERVRLAGKTIQDLKERKFDDP